MVSLTTFDKVCLVVSIVFLLAAIGFAVWKFAFSTTSCNSAKCPQIEHIIYKGEDRGADVYYALNRAENYFQTLTPYTHNVLTESVQDITADKFTVTFDFGGGIKTQIQFVKGPTLDVATVIVEVNMPSQRTISLRLTTMRDLSLVLRRETGIRSD